MPQTPSVSVCVPVFNGGKYIASCLKSVLAQTWDDFELVIIDNRSEDDTLDIVRRFDDPRIRLLVNDANLGMEGNWNRCLEEAQADLIKLLPADDVLDPECLAEQVRLLNASDNDDVVLTFCRRRVIDDADATLLTRGASFKRNRRLNGRKLIRQCARRGTNLIGEPGAVLFRKRDVAATGKFNGDIPYLIDLDYWSRLLLRGDAVMNPRPLCAFRVSAESNSLDMKKTQERDFTRFIDRLARTPEYGISSADIVVGRFNAKLNQMKRNVFYRFFVK